MSNNNKNHKFLPGDVVYYGNILYYVTVRDDTFGWDEAGMPTYFISKMHPEEPGVPNIPAAPESHLSTKPLVERVYLLEQLLMENITRDNTPAGTAFMTLDEMRELPAGTRVETADGFDLYRTIFGWVVLSEKGSWISTPALAEHVFWLRPTRVKE